MPEKRPSSLVNSHDPFPAPAGMTSEEVEQLVVSAARWIDMIVVGPELEGEGMEGRDRREMNYLYIRFDECIEAELISEARIREILEKEMTSPEEIERLKREVRGREIDEIPF